LQQELLHRIIDQFAGSAKFCQVKRFLESPKNPDYTPPQAVGCGTQECRDILKTTTKPEE
jgi:hypothetical protein